VIVVGWAKARRAADHPHPILDETAAGCLSFFRSRNVEGVATIAASARFPALRRHAGPLIALSIRRYATGSLELTSWQPLGSGWILDHTRKDPKDPTIPCQVQHLSFADHLELIDLQFGVTRVSRRDTEIRALRA